jgi:hypothetical protein
MKIAHYTLFSAEGTQIAESLDLQYIKDVAKRQKPGNYYAYEWWGRTRRAVLGTLPGHPLRIYHQTAVDLNHDSDY